MATSSYDSIFSLGTTIITITPGATNAVLLTPVAGQLSTLLKYGAGGSLEIIGVTGGQTLSAADLVAQQGGHYLMGTSEILSLAGPVRCYLMAEGASPTIVRIIRGLSQGT